MDDDKSKKVSDAGVFVFWFWVPVGVAYSILFLVEYFFLSKNTEKVLGIELNWGWFLFFAQLFYTIISFRQLGPTEIGAKLLFGKPIEEVGPGLVFVPYGIFSLARETALIIQEQYPDEPENVWKGDQEKISGQFGPSGKPMVPPIRITHKGGSKEESEADPLNKRMTTEVSFIVRYKIKKGHFITFLKTIGNVNEARRQIKDTVVSTARKELARKTPAETLKDWKEVDVILKSDVETLVRSWGVAIEDTYMEEVDLGKTVNTSLRDVPDSVLQKEVTQTRADAEKYKRVQEGMGTAEAARVFLEAKAIGYKKIASELGLEEGSFVIAAETAREALEKSKFSLIAGSGGMRDIFTLASSIQSILPKIKKEVEAEEFKEEKEKGGSE